MSPFVFFLGAQRRGWLDSVTDHADGLGMPGAQEPTLGDVVAAAVRAERARRRMTQDQLARRIGWAQSTLRELESGRRRPVVDDLPRLCEALGVGLIELMRHADPADLERMQIRL